MQTALGVRAATERDVAALVTITEQVHAIHFAARPDQFKPVDSPSIERWLEELLRNQNATIWVAESSGLVVGCVVVTHLERAEGALARACAWWFVEEIGVLLSHRGQGVCRALVEHVGAEARARGIARLELNSWAFNTEAHAAFRRLGFTPKHVRFELAV